MSTQRYAAALAVALMLVRPEQAAGQIPLGQKPPAPVPKTRITAVSTLQVAPSTTPGRLTIAWGPAAPGAVASYEIYRVGGVSGGTTELIATLVRGETALDQVMPTPGGPVGYQVVANNVDQTRDVSPWVNYAPPPLQATALSIVPNYNAPTIGWQEVPGVRYMLFKSLHPGVAAYPPIRVFPAGGTQVYPSSGGMRTLSGWTVKSMFQVPPADLHLTMHFQLITDNGRGEVAPGQWIAYQPTQHSGVTGAKGFYWVEQLSNGAYWQVLGCVSWTPIAGATQYGLSVIHGTNTQWPALQKVTANGWSSILVGTFPTGTTTDPVRVRIETDFLGAIDSQHAVEVVLTQIQQPLTTCAPS